MSARICRSCGIVHTETNPPCDCPEVLFDELIDEIRHDMDNTPRNLQKWLGPSEIGDPCPRALIAKLCGSDEPKRQPGKPDGWRARVGTAIHTQNEGVFSKPELRGRYIVEGEVNCGDINGRPLIGHSDLFDTLGCANWDWKTKSKTQFEKAKRNVNAGRGPGPLYRVQAQTYGYGRSRAGHRVRWVGIVYLLRDGDLRDSFAWFERYDESIAVAALDRCTKLAQLGQAVGVDAAKSFYPLCDGEYCDYCAADRAAMAPKIVVQQSTKDLIASIRSRM